MSSVLDVILGIQKYIIEENINIVIKHELKDPDHKIHKTSKSIGKSKGHNKKFIVTI